MDRHTFRLWVPSMNKKVLPSRSEFEVYIRTGRNISAEHKFNPWHDPQDGRFTFAGHGSYHGRGQGPSSRRGGNSGAGKGGSSWVVAEPKQPRQSTARASGGSFGGAGATSSWGSGNSNAPSPPTLNSQAGRTTSERHGAAAGIVRVPAVAASQNTARIRQAVSHRPGPLRTIERNGYRFVVDERNRTREAGGRLRLAVQPVRSRSAQSGAGRPDRLVRDDGGHYIAAQFGGPAEAFNHFAQDRNFNRGAYRELERRWAIDIAKGHKVMVRIVPHYESDSRRPDRLDVYWTVDGEPKWRPFQNRSGGK